jgi:hypothetical protein
VRVQTVKNRSFYDALFGASTTPRNKWQMACDRVIERSATDQPMNPICFIGTCMSESTFELPLRKAMQYVILLLWGKMRVGYRASTHKTYPVLFGPSIPGGVSLQNRRQVLQPDDHGMYTYCSMMFFGISSFNIYIYRNNIK